MLAWPKMKQGDFTNNNVDVDVDVDDHDDGTDAIDAVDAVAHDHRVQSVKIQVI